MRIGCASQPSDLGKIEFDLAFLPEDTDAIELARFAKLRPHAVVAGAAREGNYMRGFIMRGSSNLISYWKVGSDGRSAGCGNPNQLPVVHFNDLSVGMLICMDVDDVVLRPRVVAELNRCRQGEKVLCVPGEMSGAYFGGNALISPQNFSGLWFALSNAAINQDRCKSFIADPDGKKVVIQAEQEAIFFNTERRM